jgi:arylsulfatase A-like enzyme
MTVSEVQTEAASARRPRWWHPLVLAIAAGAVAGLVHVAVVLFRRHMLQEFTWTSRDIIWMSPVGNVIMLLVVATPFAIALAVRSHPGVWRVAVGLLGALAATSALLAIPRLHTWAVLILALGLGVQLARALRIPRGLVAGALVGAATVACVAVVDIVARDTRSVDAAAVDDQAPNILVLILDTVRAASTSLHGYARLTTPSIDSLASEGAVFEWAVSPSSWTLPSHGAMFTGRLGSALSTSWRKPLDASYPTVAEAFRDRGYATGAFVANYFYTHHESGLGRGFDVLRDFKRSPAQILWSTTFGQTPFVNHIVWGRTPSSVLAALRDFDLRVRAEPQNDRRRAQEVVSEFLDWQAGLGSSPFFAFLNLYDAHDPYVPPAYVRERFSTTPQAQDLYDAGIAYMDDELGKLFAVMRERGLLDRTLLVITSDHGEQWGEHGLKNHGNSLYLPAVHVPLVMRFPPRIAAGVRVKQPVSLTDLAATMIDAAGLQGVTLPGSSLLGACCGSPARYNAHVITETEQLDATSRLKSPAARGPLASIIADTLQYIRNGDSTYQLFNVLRDYPQKHNLLENQEGCAIGERLDSVLRAMATLPATPPLTRDRCGSGMTAARGLSGRMGGRN